MTRAVSSFLRFTDTSLANVSCSWEVSDLGVGAGMSIPILPLARRRTAPELPWLHTEHRLSAVLIGLTVHGSATRLAIP